jgi:hypothetical protein
MFEDLTEENIYIFAAKCYYNPLGVDIEEFEQDLKRFQYVRRLINRYLSGYDLSFRLILNHLITIFNVFGVEGGMKMLEFHLEKHHLPVIKPFLIFLRSITNDQMVGIVMDPHVIEKLREINVTT